MTPLWSDDLSGRSLEDLLRAAIENRAWNQSLRLETMKLVNSRLAKQISLETYAASRRIANDDAAECRRRKAILENEIGSREGRWPKQPVLENLNNEEKERPPANAALSIWFGRSYQRLFMREAP